MVIRIKNRLLFFILVFLGFRIWAADFPSGAYYDVCFTPGEQCQRQISAYIYGAKKTIEMQAYSFTAKGIAKALVNAEQRGVRVRLLIDKSEFIHPSLLYFLLQQHIPIWVDENVSIAHNKVIIVDQRPVLMGSYNYTNAAEYHNAENALFIYAPNLAREYEENWQSRLAQSIPVTLNNIDQLQARFSAMDNARNDS